MASIPTTFSLPRRNSTRTSPWRWRLIGDRLHYGKDLDVLADRAYPAIFFDVPLLTQRKLCLVKSYLSVLGVNSLLSQRRPMVKMRISGRASLSPCRRIIIESAMTWLAITRRHYLLLITFALENATVEETNPALSWKFRIHFMIKRMLLKHLKLLDV